MFPFVTSSAPCRSVPAGHHHREFVFPHFNTGPTLESQPPCRPPQRIWPGSAPVSGTSGSRHTCLAWLCPCNPIHTHSRGRLGISASLSSSVHITEPGALSSFCICKWVQVKPSSGANGTGKDRTCVPWSQTTEDAPTLRSQCPCVYIHTCFI